MAAKPQIDPVEASRRQQALLLKIVRMAFMVLFLTVTLLYILRPGEGAGTQTLYWPITLGIAVGIAMVVILIDIFTPRRKIGTLVSVFVGLLAAMLLALALSMVIDLIVEAYGIAEGGGELVAAIKVLLGIALAYLGITTVLQTEDDFRLVIPYVEFAKQIRGPRPLLLDSSALIDARIVDLCETGVVQSSIIVPEFVVDELQRLADSRDKLKRARGRRGLEMIRRLQRGTLDVSVEPAPLAAGPVDQMLVELADRMPATIVTTDVGLSRVAGIRGVEILNINEVANALKPSLVPGEKLTIRLMKAGEQAGQGVGYLDDGTMVIAEDGGEHIGEEVTLTVRSALQTSAGRLIFGRLEDGAAGESAGPAGAADERQAAPGASSEPAEPPPERSEQQPAPGPAPAPPGAGPARRGARARTGRNPRR
ncbi:MAG: PIN/TRAM domain-containing protein [Phycisphaerales bacterium JB039]